MYAFMRSFNAKNLKAFADTLLFLRASCQRRRSGVADAEAFIQAAILTPLPDDSTGLLAAGRVSKPCKRGENKVHFAVFVRHNSAGEPNATFRSLYILQRGASGWGILSFQFCALICTCDSGQRNEPTYGHS